MTLLVIGSQNDDSDSVGINGDRTNTLARNSGAAFVFVRNNNTWTEQAYIKASNTGEDDFFGASVSLSDDGKTLAVGAYLEDGKEIGVFESDSMLLGTAQADNTVLDSGAVYLYNYDVLSENWIQTAYIKASNTDSDDRFAQSVSLSGDGLTLAVGAMREDSSENGTLGLLQANNDTTDSGAVYLFNLNSLNGWGQHAYIKASNTGANDSFGRVSISDDGFTLAVSADGEDSTLINDQNDNTALDSGAAYVFSRNVDNTWVQTTYIKPNNIGITSSFVTAPGSIFAIAFGDSISLSGDGKLLAIGDVGERSTSIGLNGDQIDQGANSGAAYTFLLNNNSWTQQAFIKASNSDSSDEFGSSMSLSADGSTLAVGANFENSSSTGVNSFQNNNGGNVGAVYLY